MNGESDILFLVLTSHGSPDGLAVTAGRRAETLKPSTLAEMLERTGVRRKVVVISACYSGVFIPRLANADTLVITAADANHASFGCEDKAKWTYFGDAFFNIALRQTKTLKEAFLPARLYRSENCARALTRRTRKWRAAQTWSPCSSPALDGSAMAKQAAWRSRPSADTATLLQLRRINSR
jgi:hypothetical protein